LTTPNGRTTPERSISLKGDGLKFAYILSRKS
jgi:hypothetical protein